MPGRRPVLEGLRASSPKPYCLWRGLNPSSPSSREFTWKRHHMAPREGWLPGEPLVWEARPLVPQ